MRGPDQRRVKVERGLRQNSRGGERALWFALRDRRLCVFKFVRQEAIESYIVDFVCRERRLIVEVDGGQHAESTRNRIRDERLRAAGYTVLRFWNSDALKNKDGVLQAIASEIGASDI